MVKTTKKIGITFACALSLIISTNSIAMAEPAPTPPDIPIADPGPPTPQEVNIDVFAPVGSIQDIVYRVEAIGTLLGKVAYKSAATTFTNGEDQFFQDLSPDGQASDPRLLNKNLYDILKGCITSAPAGNVQQVLTPGGESTHPQMIDPTPSQYTGLLGLLSNAKNVLVQGCVSGIR